MITLLHAIAESVDNLTVLSEPAETQQFQTGNILSSVGTTGSSAEEQQKSIQSGQSQHLFLAMLIRLNDLTNLLDQFTGFREDCCETKDSYIVIEKIVKDVQGQFNICWKKLKEF